MALCDLSTGKCPYCGYETRHIGAKKTCTAGQPKAKSRGFGDTVAKVLSSVGVKPCGGCDKRKEFLNDMFPYKQGSEAADAKESPKPEDPQT